MLIETHNQIHLSVVYSTQLVYSTWLAVHQTDAVTMIVVKISG